MDSIEVKAHLPFDLTPEEIADKAQLHIQLSAKLDNKEEEYKLVKRQWNQEIKELKIDGRKARQVCQSGIEEREVVADHCFDSDTGQCWYEYGGKKFLEREITDEEAEALAQGTLFDDGANVPTTDEPTTAPEPQAAAADMPF
jgi:hypothetical protein